MRELRLVGEATCIIGEEGQGESSSHQFDKEARFPRGVMAANCCGDEGLGGCGDEGLGEFSSCSFPVGEGGQCAFPALSSAPHQLDNESRFLREVRGVEIETVVAESMCEAELVYTKSVPLSSH